MTSVLIREFLFVIIYEQHKIAIGTTINKIIANNPFYYKNHVQIIIINCKHDYYCYLLRKYLVMRDVFLGQSEK